MMTIPEAVTRAYDASFDPNQWDSLRINRRKPHTTRLILDAGESRICLHRFEPCRVDESFAHPHPWPSSMLILAGFYEMNVFSSCDLESTETHRVMELNLGPGSIYHMHQPTTWHQVVPHTVCYSLMVNGPRWENAHLKAPTTGGKRLEALTADQLEDQLQRFQQLLDAFIGNSA